MALSGDISDDHNCGGATDIYWVEAAKYLTMLHTKERLSPCPQWGLRAGSPCAAHFLTALRKWTRFPGLASSSLNESMKPFKRNA